MEIGGADTQIETPSPPARQPEGDAAVSTADAPSSPPSWSAIFRFHNRALTIAAGCLPPIAYLIYVANYSVNVPSTPDEWYNVPLINGALKGHVSFSLLWAQWNESRLLPTRLVILAFSFIDHWDIKTEILFTAFVYIGAYLLFLFMMARYLRGLSPVPTLVVGAIWFSLADVANALDGTQIYWLIAVFFVVATLAALLLPQKHRTAWLVLAAVLAVAASLTALPGFVVWPVGLLCLAWISPWTRRTVCECLSWVGAAIVTTAVYLPGYHQSGCIAPAGECSASFFVHHPVLSFRFLLVMMGNVVPGGYWSEIFSHGSVVRYEALGLVLLVAAIYVAVQSVRRRGHGEQMPLPLAMITFGFLWDIMTTIGRSSYDLSTAVSNNRFVLPNLLLLTGIFVYAFGRAELLWEPAARGSTKRTMAWCVAGLLAVLLIAQVSIATNFGHVNGSIQRNQAQRDARLVANLDELSPNQQACELSYVVGLHLWSPSSAERTFGPFVRTAQKDHLSLFQPAPYRYWRSKGLPTLVPQCVHPMPDETG